MSWQNQVCPENNLFSLKSMVSVSFEEKGSISFLRSYILASPEYDGQLTLQNFHHTHTKEVIAAEINIPVV
jgi:hypothetical protein